MTDHISLSGEEDIPTPRESGVSPVQSPGASTSLTTAERESIIGGPIFDLLGRVAGAQRSGAGAGFFNLAVGLVGSLEDSKRRLESENARHSRKIDELRERLKEVEIENARLKSTMGARKKNEVARELCIFIGTALFGIAIDLFKTPTLQVAGWIVLAFGVVLNAYAWITSKFWRGSDA